MHDIDEKQRLASLIPGRADYLRNNFGDLVDGLEVLSGFSVEFERTDLIRLVNCGGQVVKKIIIQQMMPNIFVIYTVDNLPYKEWKFDHNKYSGKQMLEIIKNDMNMC
jgi:sorbitol-specific phosphotransferase system component IIBC